MCHLYLTRHGETEYNAKGLEMGQLDIPLSAHGRKQAEALSSRLETIPLDAVYSSPLKRSHETAKTIASHHEIRVKSKLELRERSYGDIEGEKIATIREHLREEATNWSEWKPPNGETRAEAVSRARPVVESLCEQHPDGRIVVVSHSGINKGLITSIIADDARYGHRIAQDLTCVNEISYRSDGQWRVETLNDTTHL